MSIQPCDPHVALEMQRFQDDMRVLDPGNDDAYRVSAKVPTRFHYEHANFLFNVWLKGYERNKPC